MIKVSHTLCTGCGICVDECPIAAITLVDDIARIDVCLCDGCGACIRVCPNQALAWVDEPVPEHVGQSVSRVVVAPSIQVMPRETREVVPWRRAIFPAIGGALSRASLQVVPRIAPLTLELLNGALDCWLMRRPGGQEKAATLTGGRQGRGRRRRYRHRRGPASE